MQPNHKRNLFNRQALFLRFVLRLVVAALCIVLGTYLFFPDKLNTIVIWQFVFVATYAFIDAVFFLFRKMLWGNEGFFFVGVLTTKLLAVLLILAIVKKCEISLNHSLVLLFVICYFIYLGLYSLRIVKLMDKSEPGLNKKH